MNKEFNSKIYGLLLDGIPGVEEGECHALKIGVKIRIKILNKDATFYRS